MQLFQIIKNTSFTSSTVNDAASADISIAKPILSNNYFVYQNSIGGNVVNDNNVRDFLDKEENASLAEKFVKYLENNTTIIEFKNIFYDNKKLSSVFNEFYRETKLNSNSSLQTINNNLERTKEKNYKNYNFGENQNRLNQNYPILNNEYDESEQNYFINIKIDKKINILPKGDYSKYFANCIKGTYLDKDYLFINSINKNNIYFNIPYLKNLQNNSANNFGYAPVFISNFNHFNIGDNIILPGDGRGDEFNYRFHNFQHFANFFNYNPPKLTGTTSGIFINQISFATTGNNRTAKFKIDNNSLIEFDKENNEFLTLPITIERVNSNSLDVFYLRYENYSNVIIGKNFSFNINYQQATNIQTLTYDMTDDSINELSQNVYILKEINPEDTIILSLYNKNSIIDFLLIRCEEFIELDSYSDNSKIIIKDVNRNRLYLNCFVDYNYNNKDMENYKDSSIPIVYISQINDDEL